MSDSELSYSAEHIQRLLQCSVCLDRFKQPKLLPCQHTFCLSPCLEGLVDRLTRILRCPECRADHIVPRGGPSKFPNNLTIISFLELPPLPGDSSDSTNTSRNVSQNVVGATSQSLTAVSHLTSRSLNAGVMGREGDSNAVGGAVSGGGCSVCHVEGRLSRCSHCDQLVCDQCKRNHMDQVRADLNRLVSQVRRGLPQITEQINMIGRKGAQLQNRCESVKTEIIEAIEKHIRELKSRERLLRDDVDTFLAGELRNLRTHQENLEVELASIASFCDSTESTLSRSRHITDGDLVELKRQCAEHMETLRDYEIGTLRSPVPRNIQLSAESQFLSSTVGNFGDLIITSGSSTIRALDRTRSEQSTVRGQDHTRSEQSTVRGQDRIRSEQSPERALALTERRTTLRPPETATDYALSVLRGRSSSISPSLARRQVSPPRNARSAQVSNGHIFSFDHLHFVINDNLILFQPFAKKTVVFSMR